MIIRCSYHRAIAVPLSCFFLLASCSSEKPTPSDNKPFDSMQMEDTASQLGGCEKSSVAHELPALNTGSSIPVPIDKMFWKDTTALLELFVYRKDIECSGVLLESYQADRSLLTTISETKAIGDTNPIDVLIAMSGEATVYIGALINESEAANDFPVCPEGFATENAFNYIARTTDDSGDTVVLINSEACGSVSDFQFEDVDGQSFYDRFSYLRDELAVEMN